MSIVDNAKVIRQKLIQTLCPQHVVFHHVPKCGGTSVGRALRKRYILSQGTVTPESSFRAFEAFTKRSDREAMLVDVLDLREQMMLYLMYEDVSCVSLHVRFSNAAFENFSHRYKFVTMLREPVERFISHYYWSYGKSNAHARIEETLEDFLETDRAQKLGSTYSEYYSGFDKEQCFRSPEAISSAVNNLKKFDVVGRLDKLEDFQVKLKNELGVTIKVGHENKGAASKVDSSHAKPKYGIEDKTREKIRIICKPDIQIWNEYFNE